MNNNNLVVFDLDGTLNRTELYAVPAHKKAMADIGIFDKTDELIISTFGARADDSIPLLIDTDDKAICSEYLKRTSQYEREFITEFAGSYDGVTEMLSNLKADGYKTAVCSNASERYITMVLKALDIFEYIDYIQPLLPEMTKNDTLGLLLKKVNPAKAIMVGDRIYDKLAAKHNKIPFIGCMYGFNNSEVADADQPVTCVIDIVKAVEMLLL